MSSEEFTLKYSSAKKDEVTKEISTTLEELEGYYKKVMESWETIKAKFTLDAGIMGKLNEIGSANGEASIAETEFKKIVTSMNNLIDSLGTVDASWSGVAQEIRTAVNNFDVQKGNTNPGGHPVE